LNSSESKIIVNKRSWWKQVDQILLDKNKDNIKKQQNQGAVGPSSVVGPVVIYHFVDLVHAKCHRTF
jgi:catalase